MKILAKTNGSVTIGFVEEDGVFGLVDIEGSKKQLRLGQVFKIFITPDLLNKMADELKGEVK